jgi:hypothetical protein
VQLSILGIPIETKNELLRVISLETINDKIGTVPKENIYNDQNILIKHHELYIKFKLLFVQQTVVKTYYTFLDILQELGGLANVGSGLIGSIGFLFVI